MTPRTLPKKLGNVNKVLRRPVWPSKARKASLAGLVRQTRVGGLRRASRGLSVEAGFSSRLRIPRDYASDLHRTVMVRALRARAETKKASAARAWRSQASRTASEASRRRSDRRSFVVSRRMFSRRNFVEVPEPYLLCFQSNAEAFAGSDVSLSFAEAVSVSVSADAGPPPNPPRWASDSLTRTTGGLSRISGKKTDRCFRWGNRRRSLTAIG